MYDFNYHKAGSVAEAVSMLTGNEDAKVMAGGQTYIPTLKQRLAQPSDIIDISRIGELIGIREENGGLTIGAATTHGAVASSDLVRRTIPGLQGLAELIGDPQVRNRGTLGGSIANNDPAADYPGAVVALGATVRTNKREIPGGEFFTGMFETALEDDEIITEVHFPKPKRSAYEKFPNPASRYALVGVMIADTDEGMRVAVTGAGPCVFRASGIEAALAANPTAEAIDGAEVPADELNSDIHASAEYRAHLIKVMAKRALARLA